MKKTRISLALAVIFVFSLFGSTAFAAGGGLANDSVLSQHIKEADGTTGQNTNAGSGVKTGHIQDGAVTTGKIADGAVTDAKMTGPISTFKLQVGTAAGTVAAGDHNHDGVYQKKHANVIVVARVGGDFVDPVSAVNSITDASSGNPYIVKIMPGAYDIGTGIIQMKPYVDIEGSGEVVTKITGQVVSTYLPYTLAVVKGADNAEIRFLTIENTGVGENTIAFLNNFASPRMTYVTAMASGGTYNTYSIYNNQSSPIMTNVTAVATGYPWIYGIYNDSGSSPAIMNTRAIASNGVGNFGILNYSSSPTLTNTVATALGGATAFSQNYGIYNTGTSLPTIINVQATASGGYRTYGIYNSASASPTLASVIASGRNGSIANYGTYNEVVVNWPSGTMTADRSTFEGSTNSIYNTIGGTINIGGSRLVGSANSEGTYHCVGVYSETYLALGTNCQ